MRPAGYRPEIDGLRAIAVLPVMLFHAGLDVFGGGFVGVDVFFVISGYLITGIIYREILEDRFSVLKFYERRARRILPALLVVMIGSTAALALLLLPAQLAAFAKSALAATFSVSNVFFWLQSGYFAPDAELMPLLHTWSLGVEEQFYLLFPIFFVLSVKAPVNLRLFHTIAFALMLGIGVYLSYTRPSAAFYLLPARTWELALGALLAIGVVPALRSGAANQLAALAGLLAIAAAVLLFRGNLVFPGFAALAPCLGAALIIHCARPGTAAHFILTRRPLVLVGLISYSLYLWHWPVLTMMRVVYADLHLTPPLAGTAILLSLVLAWLTWRLVEQPFRDRARMPVPRLLRSLASAAAVLVAAAATIAVLQGFPSRLDERTARLLLAAADIDPFRERCEGFDRAGRKGECTFGPAGAPVSYALIGDSHAAALRPAVEVMLGGRGWGGTLWWRGACPPLLGAEATPDADFAECRAFRERMVAALRDSPQIGTVILAARWGAAASGVLPEVGGSYRFYLRDAETVELSADETLRVFARSLERTVRAITAMGKSVIILGGVPEPGFDVPTMLALAMRHARPHSVALDPAKVAAREAPAEQLFRILARLDGVIYLPVRDILCSGDCPIIRDGIPLYSDDDHLTLTAAQQVVGPALATRLRLARPAER